MNTYDRETEKGNRMKRKLNRGIALILVLIIVTFLVIITTAFSKSIISSLRTSTDNELSMLAFYVADSSLQYALERIATGNGGSFTLADSPSRVIDSGDIPEDPGLFANSDVVITPNVITTSPSTHTITSSAEIKRKNPDSSEELLARRIIIAEVIYELDLTVPTNPMGKVSVQYWYEKNR